MAFGGPKGSSQLCDIGENTYCDIGENKSSIVGLRVKTWSQTACVYILDPLLPGYLNLGKSFNLFVL